MPPSRRTDSEVDSPTLNPPDSIQRLLSWRRVVLAGGALLLYAGAATNGWLVWDDALYVLDNPRMKVPGVAGLLAVLSPADAYAGRFIEYFPLRDVIYWALWQGFADNPVPYHCVSIGLNAAAALAALTVLERLGLSPLAATFAAAAWLAHPTHVESVAWIAALKDPLVALFYFGALACWLRDDGRRATVAALVLFGAGLLCKSLIITLPGALILVDLLRRRSLATSLKRLLPFVALAALALPHFVLIGAANNVIVPPAGGSAATGVLTEVWAIAIFVGKLLVPTGLSLRYAVAPVLSLADWRPWFGLIVLLTLAAVVVRTRVGARPLAFAVLFYFLTLSPVLNIIPIPILVTDRYQYIPSFGLAFALGYLFDRAWARRGWRPSLAAGVIVITIYSGLTVDRVSLFDSRIALWQEALERPGGENVPVIWSALGHAYLDAGLLLQAAHCYRTLLDNAADAKLTARGHHGLALIAQAQGQPRRAYEHARSAHESFASGQSAGTLSSVALELDLVEEAVARGQEAVEFEPGSGHRHWALGVALDVAGSPEAAAVLSHALALDPNLCSLSRKAPTAARSVAALCGSR